MGKSSNGRRTVQTDKSVKYNHSTRDSDTEGNETIGNEPSARIQRLENAHGSTDVYKFAFFFFMGVTLTILLYPKISSTIDSIGETSLSNMPSGVGENSYKVEQLVDMEEIPSEEAALPDDSDEDNRTKTEVESRKYLKPNDQVKVVPKDNDKHETKPENYNKQDTSKSNDKEFADKKRDVVEECVIKDYEKERTGPAASKTESVGDFMIDEYEDSNTEPATFSPYTDDTVDVTNLNMEQESEPQRVELFNANMEDIAEEALVEMDKRTNKKAPDSETKSSVMSKVSRKATKNKSKTKSNQKNDKGSVTKHIQNVPKIIKDFKATYQKELTLKKIFVDGRRIPPMELLPQKPNKSSVKVWLLEEFLSDEECDGLMRVHNKHVEEQSTDGPILCFDSVSTLRKHLRNVGKRVQVTPMDFTPGTTCVNASFSGQLKDWLNGNWSYSTAFYPEESRFATVFEQRAKQATGLKPENGGKYQITSYPQGIGYKAHTDCTENTHDKRDRVASLMVYLDTVSEGGETEFPELGIWVRPRKGRALVWNNMNSDGDCEPMSIHRANKVLTGHKYILIRWYYYKSFYSLGKRPPEPPLPQRNPGQPRVSCDEYEHGSCRWYDEWNFEHMIEYERQKYTLV